MASGLRKKIFDSLPETVRTAIPSGIGLFTTLMGLKGIKTGSWIYYIPVYRHAAPDPLNVNEKHILCRILHTPCGRKADVTEIAPFHRLFCLNESL